MVPLVPMMNKNIALVDETYYFGVGGSKCDFVTSLDISQILTQKGFRCASISGAGADQIILKLVRND